MEVESYKAYFMSYDLVIGFILTKAQLDSLHTSSDIPALGVPLTASHLSNIKVGDSKIRALSQSSSASIDLPNQADTYAFVYYIKPNYPGRSSHMCNGGFLVPSSTRGLGLGRIAARSFCFYGPAVGYRGSVFNLVYASNEASVKLWTKLGFVNVGCIPEAGRLKKVGGDVEEYVDAWVVHGDFRKIGYKDHEEQGGVGVVVSSMP
jgi:ribosomal protein S18 acetylase RimI-like enzyme